MSTTTMTNQQISVWSLTSDHVIIPRGPFSMWKDGQRIKDWSWEAEAACVAHCSKCDRWVVANREGEWVHGNLVRPNGNVLTPEGGEAPQADAPLPWAVQEGDAEDRFCSTCGHVTSGSFGELMEAEAGGFYCPSSAAGAYWVCDECDGEEFCAPTDAD